MFFCKIFTLRSLHQKKETLWTETFTQLFFLATIVQESFKNAAYQDWERPKTSQHTNLREQIPEIWVRTKFLKKNMHNMKQDNQHLFTSKLTNDITSQHTYIHRSDLHLVIKKNWQNDCELKNRHFRFNWKWCKSFNISVLPSRKT